MSGFDRCGGTNLAVRPLLEDESLLQRTPGKSTRLDRLVLPTVVTGRHVANIPPTNAMHPIAIAMPLIAPAAMITAFWLTLADSELSLIPAVTTLAVMMLLGLIAVCGAFAQKVEPRGADTRTFREFLDGEVDVETGRISGRVAFRQMVTIPVVVAVGSTLILVCAVSIHG